jgi:hypothetical protein
VLDPGYRIRDVGFKFLVDDMFFFKKNKFLEILK